MSEVVKGKLREALSSDVGDAPGGTVDNQYDELLDVPFAGSKLSWGDVIRWGRVEAYKACCGDLPPQDPSAEPLPYSHAQALENLAVTLSGDDPTKLPPPRFVASALLYISYAIKTGENLYHVS